jgi:hypothetical protein
VTAVEPPPEPSQSPPPERQESLVPYFVYRVFPFRRLEKVGELPTYAAAAARAKALRADPARPSDCTVKLVFADSESHAEELLSQVREKAPGNPDE